MSIRKLSAYNVGNTSLPSGAILPQSQTLDYQQPSSTDDNWTKAIPLAALTGGLGAAFISCFDLDKNFIKFPFLEKLEESSRECFKKEYLRTLSSLGISGLKGILMAPYLVATILLSKALIDKFFPKAKSKN